MENVYDNICDHEKNRFENFIIEQFTIEKRQLDQILKKTYCPADYRLKNNICPEKTSKK